MIGITLSSFCDDCGCEARKKTANRMLLDSVKLSREKIKDNKRKEERKEGREGGREEQREDEKLRSGIEHRPSETKSFPSPLEE